MSSEIKTGLIVAVIIGVLLATFPLYAPIIRSMVWGEHFGEGAAGPGGYGPQGQEHQGGPGLQGGSTVSGTVRLVNEDSGELKVDDKTVIVRGVWNVKGIGKVGFKKLLTMVKVGDSVKIDCMLTESGLIAEKMVDISKGLVAERITGV